MLRDRDAIVIGLLFFSRCLLFCELNPLAIAANCISALDEILAEEGGMRINKAIAEYLIKRIRDFNEWGQCAVLGLLYRYHPETEDDYYEIMVLNHSVNWNIFCCCWRFLPCVTASLLSQCCDRITWMIVWSTPTAGWFSPPSSYFASTRRLFRTSPKMCITESKVLVKHPFEVVVPLWYLFFFFFFCRTSADHSLDWRPWNRLYLPPSPWIDAVTVPWFACGGFQELFHSVLFHFFFFFFLSFVRFLFFFLTQSSWLSASTTPHTLKARKSQCLWRLPMIPTQTRSLMNSGQYFVIFFFFLVFFSSSALCATLQRVCHWCERHYRSPCHHVHWPNIWLGAQQHGPHPWKTAIVFRTWDWLCDRWDTRGDSRHSLIFPSYIYYFIILTSFDYYRYPASQPNQSSKNHSANEKVPGFFRGFHLLLPTFCQQQNNPNSLNSSLFFFFFFL